MVTVRPLYDKVLVQKLTAEKKTSSGLILPSGEKQNAIKGQVIAVGPGNSPNENKSATPLQVKEGDIVAFNSYAGSDISSIARQENVFLIREEDILAIIEE